MDKTCLSDTLVLVVPQVGERYTGTGILLAAPGGTPVYLEGEPAAMLRLADRIRENFKCD